MPVVSPAIKSPAAPVCTAPMEPPTVKSIKRKLSSGPIEPENPEMVPKKPKQKKATPLEKERKRFEATLRKNGSFHGTMASPAPVKPEKPVVTKVKPPIQKVKPVTAAKPVTPAKPAPTLNLEEVCAKYNWSREGEGRDSHI